MKILYFYQYFSTSKGSWGTRVYEFAKNWVQDGVEVEVVSAIYTKSDLIADKFVEMQKHDGIDVRVLNVKIDNRLSILKRIQAFLFYSFASVYYALTVKTDVVVASSGPITAWIPGVLANIIRRKPLVLEVRDLWPEGAIELGIIKNKFIKKMSIWFEGFCYKRACLIVTLSPGMRDNILNRFDNLNVISVPNSANLKLFSHSNVDKNNLPSFFETKKIAIYTGNIGEVNNSRLLLRTAKYLKNQNRNDILILLVGTGQLLEELLEASKGLDNFIIHDLIPKHILVSWICSSMVSLVPLTPSLVIDTSSPNKLFESFAAGVPVVQTTNSWIKDLIDINHCGINVSAIDEVDLAKALIKLADNPSMVKMMGDNGRRVAKEKFDKNILASDMISAIREAVL